MVVEALQDKKVTVVGAGIVGLLSAYYLNRSGLKVQVFDAGPNPLIDYDRSKTGATFSGGNARHVSATETYPHASSSMNGKIYRGVNEGGWLAKNPNLLTTDEKRWMDDFDMLTWKPDLFDRFAQTVVGVNNLGKDLWRKLMVEDPELFQGTGLQEPATIFFLDEPTFQSETLVESQANLTCETIYPEEIKARYPAMADALLRKVIVGGLIVDSFALNAISFCRNLIRRLEDKGVSFTWNQAVTDVESINTLSNYYFISTGAFRQDFLRGTHSDQKIMGVAGVWIRIPNPGLEGPIKIATPYPTGYINGTVEGKSLLLSGGYGFIGQDRLDEQSPGIKTLFDDLERNVASIFPESYTKALSEDSLDQRACVRPMKPSGLGVIEILDKGAYKIVFAGGNNAGGFTQAPAVANTAVEIINGQVDIFLQRVYATDRSLYYNPHYP